jgi:ornithine carbamoyltransferase
MQHFISILDHSPDELRGLLQSALALKQAYRAGGNAPLLQGKSLAMLFMKPSLRTRVSFEMAMQHLGGHAMYLSPNEVGMGQREATADVARVLGGYTHGIMARVFEHYHLHTLAEFSGVPVINGLSDYEHPCQTMADLLTLQEHFGRLGGLHIAYVGDSNNVARSLLFATKLGYHLHIASPQGYHMDEESLELAQQGAGGATPFSLYGSAQEAVRQADVIYTDTWTSMGQEAEAEERRKVFPPYQVNTALLEAAKVGAVVLHCLPAHRGEEITDEVADGLHSLIFPQAENRLHAQKAILAHLLGQQR